MIYLTNGAINELIITTNLFSSVADLTLILNDTEFSVTNTSDYPARYAKFNLDLTDVELSEGTYELYNGEDLLSTGLFKIKTTETIIDEYEYKN